MSIAGCPTKRAMPRLIWRLITSTYLPYELVAKIAYFLTQNKAVTGSFRQLEQYCCWLITMPLYCLAPPAFPASTIWIHVSMRQVCVRRSISVSHSMARLPVWSSRVEATVWLRRCAFLTLFLSCSCSCFVFFLPFSVLYSRNVPFLF